MKKTVIVFMVLVFLSMLQGIAAASSDSPAGYTASSTETAAPTVLHFFVGRTDYYRNDVKKALNVAPFSRQGRTLIPVRFVAEALGASVDWYQERKEAVISLDGKTIKLWLAKTTAEVNGESIPIDSENPTIVPASVAGRVFVPMRFILEALDAEVAWVPEEKSITVSYPRAVLIDYENTAAGIKMQYPQNWSKQEDTADAASVLFESPIANNVNVAADKLPSPMTLTQFTLGMIEVLNDSFPVGKVIESSDMLIDGNPAHRYTFVMTVNGIGVKVMNLWTIKGDKAYLITYTAGAGTYTDTLPAVLRMIDSVTIS